MYFLNTLFIICITTNLVIVNSFKLSQVPSKVSENDMFEKKNENKKVEYLKTIIPSSKLNFIGQVGGIDTDIDGNLVVFHRASRRWTFDSFFGNKFNTFRYGPIKQDVLTLIDSKTMKPIESWGEKRFYMPHGLTIDHEDNIWLTDVGLHQVFKFDFRKSEEPQLVLGTEFETGSDETHFCKPTDVAVSTKNQDIFVSDGYCNQRIVQFDKEGNFKKEFKDTKNPIQVAHSIALIEKLNLICTVSREEGRIVCFDIDSGEKRPDVTDPDMLTVYAIQYDPINEVIHASSGFNQNKDGFGFTFSAKKDTFGKLIQKWSSDERDLKEAHDIATSPDGSRVYMGQLNGEIDEFTFE